MPRRDPEAKRQYEREYGARPYVKEAGRARYKRRKQDPIFLEAKRARSREYMRKRRRTLAYRQIELEYRRRPETIIKNRARSRKRQAKDQAYKNQRRHENLNYRLARSLRTRLIMAVQSGQKGGSAVADLGCTIPEFKLYIESLFQPGMSWGNWSRTGWHLDHKKPLASFDLTDRAQFLQAAHYTNIQPLWAEDNHFKNRRIPA